MFAVPDAAGAASLVPGNLVAAVIDATGVIPAPTYIAEYQTSGTRVQTLANVPQPGGTARTQDRVFDLVHGPGNAIHLYNVDLIMSVTFLLVVFAASVNTIMLVIDHRLHHR